MLPRPTFLVALYLLFDVANPMMPGALTFSAEDSVEARLAHRLCVDDVATASALAPERLEPVARIVVGSFPAIRDRRMRFTHVARPRLSPPPSAAPAEDD